MIVKNIYILNTCLLLESFSNNIQDKNMKTKENPYNKKINQIEISSFILNYPQYFHNNS